jgi:hypothetical protein
MRLPLLLLPLLLGACPSTTPPNPNPGPSISGQVVDLESCFTTAGCTGVTGLKVAFFHNTSIVSDITHPSGGYTLTDVPVGVRDYAVVSDAANGNYLTVLQTVQIGSTGSDVYGVELYALKRTGGLFEAVINQAGVDINTSSLYFGVAAVVDPSGMTAVSFAKVTASPASTIRYVSCTPAVKDPPCTEPLYDSKRDSTGPLGEFLVVSPSKATLSVQVSATNATLDSAQAPVSTGYLTLGVHRGKFKPDGGVPKVDVPKVDGVKKDAGKKG